MPAAAAAAAAVAAAVAVAVALCLSVAAPRQTCSDSAAAAADLFGISCSHGRPVQVPAERARCIVMGELPSAARRHCSHRSRAGSVGAGRHAEA